jgi:SAM-dependent methyltransferase
VTTEAVASLRVVAKSIDSYADRAKAGIPVIEVSGRYPSQSRDERNVVRDVVDKLDLSPDDTLLEIGCGPGTLLIPLAFRCAAAAGIDNAASLDLLASRFSGPPEITLLAGDFFTMTLDGEWDTVLVYNTLHALPTVDDAFRLAHRAAGLLAPGGRLLLGDLANREKRARFHTSPAGVEFQREWEQRQAGAEITTIGADDQLVGAFDDATIARLLLEFRAAGFESYLLPQPPDLPFGRTREDILVRRLA